MDIEFGINSLLFFLFLITPGFLFRRFYFQGEFTKQFYSKDWTYTILSSTITGLIIQIITLISFINIINIFNLKDTLGNYATLDDIKSLHEALKAIDIKNFYERKTISLLALGYLLLVYCTSFLTALISWSFVRLLKLDRKFKIFRFSNYWNYYFKGEIKDFNEFSFLNKGKVLYTLADVLVQTNSGDKKMYSGTLSQYTIEAKTNKLEYIYLTNVKKWKWDKEKKIMQSIPFKSDCFILDVKNILDINLNYIFKESKKRKELTDNIISILMLSGITFIIFSNNQYLVGTNWFYTITTKTSLTVLLIAVLTLFTLTFNIGKTKDKTAIKPLFWIIIILTIIHIGLKLL